MSLLDSQEEIEQKTELAFPITEDWLKEIGMCWHEWDTTCVDIITPGFAWGPTWTNPKFKGWSIKYEIFTEKWLLRRVEPNKCGNVTWRYSIKCRKEFIDIISNCKEI